MGLESGRGGRPEIPLASKQGLRIESYRVILVSVATRQCDTEGAAHSFLAVRPYLASLGLDELFSEEESKAGARLRSSIGVVGTEKLAK